MIEKSNILDEAKKIISIMPLNANKHYIASGNHSDVFRLNFENKSYAVKKFHNRLSVFEGESFKNHLPLYESVIGIKYVVQLVNNSQQDDIIITSFIDGLTPTSIDVSKTIINPERAIQLLIETLIQMHEKGVVLDPNPENIKIYEDEFYIIDFSKKPNEYSFGYEIGQHLIPNISINFECLLALIPSFFSVLNNFKKIKDEMINQCKVIETHIENMTEVYSLQEIQGLNIDEQLMSKLIQMNYKLQK